MKNKHWQRLGLATFAIALTWTGLPLRAQAQVNSQVNPLEGLDSSAGSGDPFSRNGSGQSSSLLQLLNQIQTTNGGSREAQLEQNRYEIRQGADEFRRRQLELLNDRNSPSPESGGAVPVDPTNPGDGTGAI